MITNYLRNYFQVFVVHPEDCESIEDQVGGIIMRNTWNDNKPDAHYGYVWERFRKKGLKTHDYLYTYPGEGKQYLLDLYNQGYPVIPTIDNLQALSRLPIQERYIVKPRDGFSAIGVKKVSRKRLAHLDLHGQLIQPLIDFEYEVSFYYIDKVFQHALYAPSKKRWNLVPYKPTAEDMAFAEKFIRWNPQKYGIERIDGCRTKEGKLLLMEITDYGGVCLSIPTLPEDLRQKFLNNLVCSINQTIFNE